MKLPEHVVPTRAQVLPDLPPATDGTAVARARATLQNASLLRSIPAGWGVTALQAARQGMILGQNKALVGLGHAVLEGQSPKIPVIQLMAFAAASNVLDAVRAPLAVAWTSAVRDRYDEAFVVSHFNRPKMWVLSQDGPSKSEKAARTVLYASNLRWHADNQVQATMAMQAVVFGATANMALFALTIGSAMAGAQLIALALTFMYGRRAYGAITQTSVAQQKADAALGAHMKRLWDNVTLGNGPNLSRWRATYDSLRTDSDRTQEATAQESMLRELTLMALAAGPILLGVCLGLARAANAPSRADMRAHIQDILLQGPSLLEAARTVVGVSESYWNGLRKRQDQLNRTLAKCLEQPELDVMALCRQNPIEVVHNGLSVSLADAWPDLLQAINGKSPGHWQIRGGNGTGKSMALLNLQSSLDPTQRLLIPAHLGQLEFGIQNKSTGESDLLAIDDVLRSNVHLVMLDEPTAHLHDTAIAALNEKIAQATAPISLGGGGHLVLEVSHR